MDEQKEQAFEALCRLQEATQRLASTLMMAVSLGDACHIDRFSSLYFKATLPRFNASR